MTKKKIVIAIFLAQSLMPVLALEPREAIDEANEAIIQGNLDAAKVVLEGAITENPSSLPLYNALGRVYTLLGDLNEAERVLKTGITEYSNASELFDNLLKVNELRVSERYRRALGITQDESVKHVLNVAETWRFSPEYATEQTNISAIASNTVSIPNEESVAIVPDENTTEQGGLATTNGTNGITDSSTSEPISGDVVAVADAVKDAVSTETTGSTEQGSSVDEKVIGGTKEELDAIAQESTAEGNGVESNEAPENDATASVNETKSDNNVALKDAEAVIEKWRSAWSSRDALAYVATYAPDYAPSDDMSHDDWIEDRKRNFSSKNSITVEVEDLEANFVDDKRIRARFTQRYTSNNYKDVVVKRITLINRDDVWLIEQEISSPVD